MNVTIEMTANECISCGITFAMPEKFVEALRKSHANFYCPNGHPMVYGGKSDAERRVEELNGQLATEKMARAKCEAALKAAPAAMGRAGGNLGGIARAASLTPERRKEIASEAAKARWTPERRAAQAERAKAMHARRKAGA